GFLITGLLVEEIRQAGHVQWAGFYIRRLRRLLPALATMILVTGAAAALLLAPAEQGEQANAAGMAALWLSNIYFTLNRLDYFSPGNDTNLFLHTWSLGVEEQFYLVWPLLLFWLCSDTDAARGERRLRLGLYCVLVLSLGACIYLTYVAPAAAFYLMPMRAWQFALGALVKLTMSSPRGPRLPMEFGWLGLGAILAAGALFDAHRPYPGVYALLPSLGAAIVIAAGMAPGAKGVSSFLSWKPLQAIGRVSYAWYLWHWPALLLAKVLADSDGWEVRVMAVGTSLLLAALSYRYIEAPIRHQEGWLRRRLSTLLVATLAMGALAMLAGQWSDRAGDASNDGRQAKYARAHNDSPAIYGMGCDDWYASDRLKPCAFGNGTSAHVAVLMGDSIAGQWFPATEKLFAQQGWRLVVLTKSSCPMVEEPFFYARIGREYTECSRWREKALDYVRTLRPDLVMLSTVSTNGFSEQQWVEGTERVLERLSQATGHIYILRATPYLPFDGPNCLAQREGRPAWLGTKALCSAPSDDAHALMVLNALSHAVTTVPNASIVDLNDRICPGGICYAQRQGVIVFRDGQHLTASYAASLAPVLGQELQISGY
ncbi:MAG TPA: acyltransferase family protein, partial [Dyella sp.]|uniref:acyltransferase family protein n=1 Tax=Dyella sp. TaxID=1869338 RepID=UPI002F9208F8